MKLKDFNNALVKQTKETLDQLDGLVDNALKTADQNLMENILYNRNLKTEIIELI